MLLQNNQAKKKYYSYEGDICEHNEKNVGEKSIFADIGGHSFMTSAKNLENCEEELSAGTS